MFGLRCEVSVSVVCVCVRERETEYVCVFEREREVSVCVCVCEETPTNTLQGWTVTSSFSHLMPSFLLIASQVFRRLEYSLSPYS